MYGNWKFLNHTCMEIKPYMYGIWKNFEPYMYGIRKNFEPYMYGIQKFSEPYMYGLKSIHVWKNHTMPVLPSGKLLLSFYWWVLGPVCNAVTLVPFHGEGGKG